MICIARTLWLVVVDTRWWLLGALLFTGFLVRQWWTPRYLRRRQLLLAEPGTQPW